MLPKHNIVGNRTLAQYSRISIRGQPSFPKGTLMSSPICFVKRTSSSKGTLASSPFRRLVGMHLVGWGHRNYQGSDLSSANPIRTFTRFWKVWLFTLNHRKVILSRSSANPIRTFTRFWKVWLFTLNHRKVILSRSSANPIRTFTRFWKVWLFTLNHRKVILSRNLANPNRADKGFQGYSCVLLYFLSCQRRKSLMSSQRVPLIPPYTSEYPMLGIWRPTWDAKMVMTRTPERFQKWEFDNAS